MQLDLFADNEQEPGQNKPKKAKRRNLAEDLADGLGDGVTVEMSAN